MRWVFTGFTPFLEHDFNPSWPAAEAAAEALSGEAHLLQVTFEDAALDAANLVASDTRLIMFGLAAARTNLEFERFAHNIQGEDGVLVPDGPLALQTSLPLKSWQNTWNLSADLPQAAISRDAGDYVCNALYYHALWLGCSLENFECVFVHLPTLNEVNARAVGQRVAEVCAQSNVY